jgi:hypothetical protein
MKMNNNIEPAHYTNMCITPIEYITSNNLEFEVGNIIKYISRFENKNGLEDLLKAKKYLDMLIERKYPNEK